MEPNDHEAISPTPTAKTYNEGDLVHVFQGTAAYVRGRNTVSFIGSVVGYNDAEAKWEVHFKPVTYACTIPT